MTKRKLQINVDERAYSVLQNLQKETGAASIAEVIRMSVTLFDWARVQTQEGFTVGAFQNGRPVKEVMLSFLPLKPAETGDSDD